MSRNIKGLINLLRVKTGKIPENWFSQVSVIYIYISNRCHVSVNKNLTLLTHSAFSLPIYYR